MPQFNRNLGTHVIHIGTYFPFVFPARNDVLFVLRSFQRFVLPVVVAVQPSTERFEMAQIALRHQVTPPRGRQHFLIGRDMLGPFFLRAQPGRGFKIMAVQARGKLSIGAFHPSLPEVLVLPRVSFFLAVLFFF